MFVSSSGAEHVAGTRAVDDEDAIAGGHVFQPHAAVREGAGLLDFSDMAKFEVSGRGAEAFLDRLCANALPSGVGEIVDTPMLSPAGRLVCFVCLMRLAPNRFYLTAEPEAELHHYEWMRQRLPAQRSATGPAF